MADGPPKEEAHSKQVVPPLSTRAKAKDKKGTKERAKEVRAREYASTADSLGTWREIARMQPPTKGAVPTVAIGATRPSTANIPRECRT